MPRRIFAFALGLLSPGKNLPTFKSSISKNCIIKKGALIGNNVKIGDHVIIGENSVIGDGVSIGDYSEIGSNCSINFSKIGQNSLIYPGVRIGTTGFGFNFDDKGVYKFPHRGRVIIKDNVEIGANTCVDKATFDSTIIGDGCKIDNLVQIAHNSVMGKYCIMAGNSGLAGSVTLGDGVMIGGSASVKEHTKIGSGASVGAGSGVISDVPEGTTVLGYPAAEYREMLKQWVAIKKLTKS